ncbi:GerAB/ArcD/ProY family transporter [Priestia megaterium]|nr:GerAB/ArcD/ProY family transporter [Priestia megaterium]
MEKAKISASQLFILIVLFELGSALLVPLAMEARQDAWLAIFLGMIGSLFLFLIYHQLYSYYPDELPTEYMKKIVGKYLGSLLAFLYIVHFAYAAARVLRDFGEMLVTFAYVDTPLFIVNALLMLAIIYTVRKGIEVIARTGELLFILIYILAVFGFILIVSSGLMDLNNLKPVLEEGISRVLKVVLTQSLFVPFGEAVVFIMILPYLNDSKKARITGLCALVLSGINLTITMAINIAVLGVNLTGRSQFPLLTTVQSIQVADFLERLDVFFMLALVVGGFIKICVFFYAVVIGTASLFKVKKSSTLAYPLGLVILFFSMTIASNFQEHLQEGLELMPALLFIPFHATIPLVLLIIAYIRKKREATNKTI